MFEESNKQHSNNVIDKKIIGLKCAFWFCFNIILFFVLFTFIFVLFESFRNKPKLISLFDGLNVGCAVRTD